ncbi:MAG: ABC transporter, partial [Nocardioides sp.]|nr:ABC transporter [Nocardioides sp.]
RVLILQEGAKIAQYDTPETILAAPANDFVEDFVGSGSALKQLTLSRVSEVELQQRPTAVVGEASKEAVARAEAAGERSVIVLDDRRRPVAWRFNREVARHDKVQPGDRETLVTVDQRATLNDALDTMLASSHGGVIVCDSRDQYLGVVDFESVTDHMRTVEQEAVASREAS